MRRYNIFQTAHSALRAQLLDASLQLQFTNYMQPYQVQYRFDQVIDLILSCQRQAEEETRYILPLLYPFFPDVPDCFADSTKERPSPLNRMIRHMNLVEQTADSFRLNKWAGCLITASFRHLSDWVIKAMQRQEEILNPLLWKSFSDETLYALQLQIEGKQTMAEWLSLCSWMLRDMSDDAIAGWLREMENSLPVPVYEMLLNKVADRLHPMKWEMIWVRMDEQKKSRRTALSYN